VTGNVFDNDANIALAKEFVRAIHTKEHI